VALAGIIAPFPSHPWSFSMLPMTPLDSSGGAAGVWLGVLDLPPVTLVAEGLADQIPAWPLRTAARERLGRVLGER